MNDTAVLLCRSLRHIIRSPDTIITTLAMPIAFTLMFVYVLGGAIQAGPGSYVNYLLTGILLITIASGISCTAYRLFLDMQGGIFERLQSMPIARPAVIPGLTATTIDGTSAFSYPLAAYAGVTVRRYYQIGLLPEPGRDAAGVPLTQIGPMLHADPATFAETVRRIDEQGAGRSNAWRPAGAPAGPDARAGLDQLDPAGTGAGTAHLTSRGRGAVVPPGTDPGPGPPNRCGNGERKEVPPGTSWKGQHAEVVHEKAGEEQCRNAGDAQQCRNVRHRGGVDNDHDRHHSRPPGELTVWEQGPGHDRGANRGRAATGKADPGRRP